MTRRSAPADAAHGRVSREVGARRAPRRAHDPLRRRPDGDGRLPHLACGGAAGGALADGCHRRRPVLRPGKADRPLLRAARLPRRRSAEPRHARAPASTSASRACRRHSCRVTVTATCSPASWGTSTRSRTSTCAGCCRRSSRSPPVQVRSGWSRRSCRRPRWSSRRAWPPPGSWCRSPLPLWRWRSAAPRLRRAARSRPSSSRRSPAVRSSSRTAGWRTASSRSAPPTGGWCGSHVSAALADGTGEGCGCSSPAGRWPVCSRSPVSAHAVGTLDRVLIGLLALASLRFVRGCPAPARGAPRAADDGRRRRADPRADRPQAGRRRPGRSASAPTGPVHGGARGRSRPLRLRRTAGTRRRQPQARAGPPGCAARAAAGAARRPSRTCSCASSTPRRAGSTLAGRDLRELPAGGRPPRDRRRGPGLHLFSTTIRENVRLARRRRRTTRSRVHSGGRGSWTGSAAFPTVWNTLCRRGGRELSGGQRQRPSSPARCSRPRRCSCSTSRPRTSTRRRPSA